jgi:hypothetical protein
MARAPNRAREREIDKTGTSADERRHDWVLLRCSTGRAHVVLLHNSEELIVLNCSSSLTTDARTDAAASCS